MIKNVLENPVIPIHWGAAQKGMQAFRELESHDQFRCESNWLMARDNAVECVQKLLDIGLHKQIANRILEPWMWITVILSTTSLKHFRQLRCHPDAEPHMQKIARMMVDAYDSAEHEQIGYGDWHLPLTGFSGDENLSIDDLKRVSVARCARVSYLTHDGNRDVQADIELHDKLASNKHWSPFEHVAMPDPYGETHGNFKGWVQYRKSFVDEFVSE